MIEVLPAWLEPLSTIQNTVRADFWVHGGHDLVDEPAERLDPGLGLDAIKEVGMVDVPGGQVGQRPAAAVLKLDQRRTPRPDRDGLVAAPERLQLGFLDYLNAVDNRGVGRRWGSGWSGGS